ncbi:hypothetical protein EMG21_26245 [Klebsiella pneumoniae]|nr:hypothetical protein EMG21_26245 [Klebsiella pneumoniae]
MMNLELHVNIDASELAREIVSVMNDDDILEFILEIEENVMDWRFTKRLRDKLSELLAAEEEGEL